jgi:hypothetical protein
VNQPPPHHKGETVNKLYAGIGSRETPPETIQIMQKLGYSLARRVYTLRSGAAKGADSAFEFGCDVAQGHKEIWLPWLGYDGRRDSNLIPMSTHFELASTLHPAWQYLKDGAKALHARNTGQILGPDLQTPVDFVVCYTQDGAESHEQVTKNTGGTGTAIRLASMKGIPVINLANPNGLERVKALVNPTGGPLD